MQRNSLFIAINFIEERIELRSNEQVISGYRIRFLVKPLWNGKVEERNKQQDTYLSISNTPELINEEKREEEKRDAAKLLWTWVLVLGAKTRPKVGSSIYPVLIPKACKCWSVLRFLVNKP